LRTTDRGWSFGRQLVKLGLLGDQDLAHAERRRVLSVARAAIGLRSGQYACEAGAVAGDAMPNQAIEVPRVVAEGVLTTWEPKAKPGAEPKPAAAPSTDKPASAAAPSKAPTRLGPIIVLLLSIALLAGAGYIAWRGWAEMQSAPESP